MEANKRVVQADVAKAAGVHRATVSLALRGHPGIPAVTRERVLRCAERLGYKPDPLLTALASYRSSKRPVAFHGMLGWLTNCAGEEKSWDNRGWKGVPHYWDYYQGAKSRADRFGYQVEEFNLKERDMTPSRLASILKARNVLGLLICPQPRANADVEFAWKEFSAVTFGYSLVQPQLHMVTSAHFMAMKETMKRLFEMGYRRIGFDLSPFHDERVGNNFLAGYLLEIERAGMKHSIPPFRGGFSDPEKLRKWIVRHRLDALITGHDDAAEIERYSRIGLRVPDDIGLACPAVGNPRSPVAGIREDSFHAGEVALDFLVGMIHRGERGVPASPQRILVEGTWSAGTTLRRMEPTESARSTV